jgi:hypothetical protein
MNKVKYPAAIKKRVKGDWNCENCMNLNFSFRQNCNLCGHFKDVPALFSCALYYNTKCLFSQEEETNQCQKIWMSLPDVQAFVDVKFMQKPTEVYLLNERCMNIPKKLK